MEIIKTIRDGDNELHNHIRIEGKNYIHKQIEKTGNRIYMRIKTRRLLHPVI